MDLKECYKAISFLKKAYSTAINQEKNLFAVKMN